MKDQSRKLDQIKKENQEIFEGLLGYQLGKTAFNTGDGKHRDDWRKMHSTGNLQGGLLFQNEFLQVNPDESVVFSNGSIVKKVATGWASLSGLDFKDKAYRWLVDNNTKFICQNMSVRDGDIIFTKGEWISGEFRGKLMYSSSFNGGFFNGGKFEASQWKAHPFNFINGTWDVDGSILGLRDISTLNQNSFKINIVSIVPGNKMIIQMEDGKSHEITVRKRLDNRSSDFIFLVKNGETGEEKPVSVRWGTLRSDSPQGFEKTTMFSNSEIPLLFTDIFGLKFASPITKLITKSSTDYAEEAPQWSEKEKSEKELSQIQQKYDLSKVGILGISALPDDEDNYWDERGILVKNNIGRAFFNTPTGEYLKGFEAAVKNLDSGVMAADFNKLRDYLDNKIITGAPAGYDWLANLIGNDTSGKQITDENFLGALKRIDDFLKYFVNRIVKYAGQKKREKGQTDEKHNKVIKMIKDNLRKYLGVNVQDPEEGGGKKKTTRTIKKPPIGESVVRDRVRKIISDNLKHF